MILRQLCVFKLILSLTFTVYTVNAEQQHTGNGIDFPGLSAEGLGPADPSEAFIHANDLYIQGQFEDASLIYEQIITSGYYSAQLYYNLGNSYFRSNRIPSAILNFERAALLAPADEDIRFNLELARMLTRDRIEELPGFFLHNWWILVRDIAGTGQWAVLSVITFIVFLAFIAVFLMSPSVLIKKVCFWSGVILFVISALSFTLGLDQRNHIQNHNAAIVFSPVVSVKSSPDINSTDLFVIHEGTKVWVDDSIGDWRAVRLSDGNKGWLKKETIEMI